VRPAAEGRIWAIASTAVAVLAAHTMLSLNLGEGYAIPTTIIGAIAAAVVLRGPVGQALARRIAGEVPSGAAELPAETVLGELDDLRARMLELEERVDFSERLLAQARAGQPPPAGGDA
jgi:hypothetical protein